MISFVSNVSENFSKDPTLIKKCELDWRDIRNDFDRIICIDKSNKDGISLKDPNIIDMPAVYTVD